jgi:hypothetical protein
MTAKKYNQAEMRAYSEAFDCFEMYQNGGPREGNPYRCGTTRFLAWQDGWKEATDNRAREVAIRDDLEERRATRAAG